MENLIKDYTTYLFDIGLVNMKSIKDFIKILNEIFFNYEKNSFNKQNEIKEILIKALSNYFSCVSNEEKMKMAGDIFNKFEENRDFELMRKAKLIFSIYSQKLKTIKNLYFDRWKITNLNSTNFTIVKNPKRMHLKRPSNLELLPTNIKETSCLNSSKFNLSGSICHKSHMDYETTTSLKEKEELKECTFKPKINKFNFSYEGQNLHIRDSTIDTFTRLYTDHERYTNKKLIRTLQNDFRDSKINSFSPNTSLSASKNLNFSLQSKSFFDRLNQYEKIQRMKKDDIRDSIEDSCLKICTFTPETNQKELIFNENSKSVYKRLFDDHSRRKYNSQLNLKKSDDEFESMANKKHLKIYDKKRIEKLYNDNKKFKTNKITLQKIYDEEEGITFKPMLINSEKYQFQNDFYQRNEILLHKKNIFSDWYQKILKENFNSKNKQYTPEEAEEIKNNIIERLYKRDLDKFIVRKNLREASEDDKLNYVANLRNNKTSNEFYKNPEKRNKSQKYLSTIELHSSRSKSKYSPIVNNSVGMRFSFKNNNSDNTNHANNDLIGSNNQILNNYNNEVITMNNLNNYINESNSKNNFNSKTDENNHGNNNDSVITEIENNQNSETGKFKEYNSIKKNLSKEDFISDKKYKTIENQNYVNGSIKGRESDVLLSHFMNNQNYNMTGRIVKSSRINNYNKNNKNINLQSRIAKNDRVYQENNHLILNQISVASPQNMLSTKSTNYNYKSAVSDNKNTNFSNMDQYEFYSNNEINSVNNNFDTIHLDPDCNIDSKY